MSCYTEEYKKFKDRIEQLFIDAFGEDEEFYFPEILHGEFENFAAVEFIKQDGGGEGGTEDCYTVLLVEGKYYKVFYSYASYDGFYYDYASVREVKPVDRMVTFYE